METVVEDLLPARLGQSQQLQLWRLDKQAEEFGRLHPLQGGKTYGR